jgi:hypothetical protein
VEHPGIVSPWSNRLEIKEVYYVRRDGGPTLVPRAGPFSSRTRSVPPIRWGRRRKPTSWPRSSDCGCSRPGAAGKCRAPRGARSTSSAAGGRFRRSGARTAWLTECRYRPKRFGF